MSWDPLSHELEGAAIKVEPEPRYPAGWRALAADLILSVIRAAAAELPDPDAPGLRSDTAAVRRRRASEILEAREFLRGPDLLFWAEVAGVDAHLVDVDELLAEGRRLGVALRASPREVRPGAAP